MPISDYISAAETGLINKRAALAADHFLAGSEQAFTGVDDQTGFTVVYCTTADQVISEIANTTTNQKKWIYRQWNGLSTAATSTVLCVHQNDMTPNGSVEWGYDRPDWTVVIEDAPGYSPDMTTATYDDLDLVGAHQIHVKGGKWSCTITTRSNATYPGWAMLAITDATLEGTGIDKPIIAAYYNRVAHIENVDFVNCQSCIIANPNFIRVWNCTDIGHRDNDIIGLRGFGADQANLYCNAWIAGFRQFNMDGSVVNTGLHPDFFQIMTFGETVKGYRNIIEFNVAHLNGKGGVYETQGVFGNSSKFADQPGGPTLDQTCEFVIHNNIIAIGASWGLQMQDPQDNGEKYCYRNMSLRCASRGKSASYDAYPYVIPRRGTDKPAGTGLALIKDNYLPPQDHSADPNLSSNTIYVNNIGLDPRSNSDPANIYSVKLSGNDGLGGGFTGGDYNSPDDGITDPAAAFTAFTGFIEPQGGWMSEGVGPTDPAAWPTDFRTLQGPPALPVMGRNITINLVAG